MESGETERDVASIRCVWGCGGCGVAVAGNVMPRCARAHTPTEGAQAQRSAAIGLVAALLFRGRDRVTRALFPADVWPMGMGSTVTPTMCMHILLGPVRAGQTHCISMEQYIQFRLPSAV